LATPGSSRQDVSRSVRWRAAVSAALGRTLMSLDAATLSASFDTPTEWNYFVKSEKYSAWNKKYYIKTM